MSPFWLAWTFLTIFPGPGAGPATMTQFVRSRVWYPTVGAALGLAWCAVAFGARALGASEAVVAVAVLSAMLLSTGFLHLDGLLDSADALLVPKDATDRLRILKDVHMGSFAFGAGGLWFLGMFATLESLGDPRLLLALPVLSRGVLLIPIHAFPYARALPEDPSSLTTASERPSVLGWLVALIPTLAAAWFFPIPALVVLITQLLVAWWSSRRLGGGITGDIYGACIVLSELAALAVHGLTPLL
jgi:adenosylcobinamide-GDP ribazoletransferase